MKAYVIKKYGENARFEEAEAETPSPKGGEILIEVRATSLNPADFKLRTMDLGINPPIPAILHMDVAGVVTKVGKGVSAFNEGDEVYGCAGGVAGLSGSLADFMIADTDLVAHKPKSLSFEAAAALPLVSITAWEALKEKTALKSDDHILIHGGTGGVGHLALQLAKQIGATVSVSVSSDKKANIAKELGADYIINYREEKVEEYIERLTSSAGFDVVFDTVGETVLDQSLIAVRNYGQVVTIISHNTHDLSNMHMKSLSLHVVFMLLPMITGRDRPRHGNILKNIAKLVDEGSIKPLIHDERFTFAQANDAHALYATGNHVGKIVLIRESHHT